MRALPLTLSFVLSLVTCIAQADTVQRGVQTPPPVKPAVATTTTTVKPAVVTPAKPAVVPPTNTTSKSAVIKPAVVTPPPVSTTVVAKPTTTTAPVVKPTSTTPPPPTPAQVTATAGVTTAQRKVDEDKAQLANQKALLASGQMKVDAEIKQNAADMASLTSLQARLKTAKAQYSDALSAGASASTLKKLSLDVQGKQVAVNNFKPKVSVDEINRDKAMIATNTAAIKDAQTALDGATANLSAAQTQLTTANQAAAANGGGSSGGGQFTLCSGRGGNTPNDGSVNNSNCEVPK